MTEKNKLSNTVLQELNYNMKTSKTTKRIRNLNWPSIIISDRCIFVDALQWFFHVFIPLINIKICNKY